MIAVGLFFCLGTDSIPADESGFRVGVRFLSPKRAEVRWESDFSGSASVAFGPTRKLGTIVESSETGATHRVIVDGLVAGETYFYRIGVKNDGRRKLSPFYEFDTRMNYTLPEFDSQPAKLSLETVKTVVTHLPHQGGFAVVAGQAVTSWAETLASESALTVVASSTDEDQVQRLRQSWQARGVYGLQLSAQRSDAIPRGIANLVVANADQLEEMRELLSPGGVLVLLDEPADADAWMKVDEQVWLQTQAADTDLAEWGHQYGSSANLSYSGETLSGADETHELEVRWLGKPGADFGIDRNPRMPAPLAVGGRVLHQGMNRMIALDAFNGAVLWSLEIPDLRRVNIPRDCSNWCADKEHVYAATHDCLWVIDAATGEMLHTLQLPGPYDGHHEWGYIAATDDMLIGSAVKGDSIYEEFWNKAAWYDGKGEAATSKICADAIVAYDKTYGDLLWKYEMDAGVQSTITIVDDQILFVETVDPELQDQASGKLTNQQIWPNASVVCLDRKTGSLLWRKPVAQQGDDQIVAFGLADDQQFVLQTSFGGQFHFVSYRREDGEMQWQRDVKWPSDNHGAHMQHAVLMDGKLFVQPHILDAASGKVLQTGTLGKRRGCATPIGSGGSILYRGGTGPLSLWSLENEKPTEFARLRPSCWLSTIPAQGMLFSPEAGGGCSCGGWMECSIGFAPRKATSSGEDVDEVTETRSPSGSDNESVGGRP
ncbi:MAG: PQQ-binding-like beta-propeller repeat protein [Rubripirellula sp.]